MLTWAQADPPFEPGSGGHRWYCCFWASDVADRHAPVMEGKCALFKAFGDVDAIPLCVRSKEVDDIVNTVRLLAGSFGGINLEDISAPRCFEIERRLKECCDIPIFHDDQHGTAVVTLAAMLNALKLTGKKIDEIRVVTSGAGAAGIAIIRLLIAMGLKDVVLCDRHGAIYQGRENLNPEKEEMAAITNKECRKGTLAEVLKGADVFIGVSAPGCVTPEMVKSMALNPICLIAAVLPRKLLCPIWQKRLALLWWVLDAATSRTRSTTSWLSRAFSVALWTYVRATLTMR